jgi:Asp-tRNA(Asn)/Glu-tRNA(Gln) amidotransferase B subunit
MSRTISKVRISLIQDNITINKEIWGIGDCGGEEKALGALVGTVMKSSKGKADGKVITALLKAKKTA